ncbi:MAG TPA: serine/threonine-protein kinase, partial [Gemmataceae bacterium]
MPADPSRAKSIFMAALTAGTPAEREAYLAGACGDDPALRGRVEELLRANDAPGSFLDTPAAAAFADPTSPPGDDTRTGSSGPVAGDGIDFLDPSDTPGSVGRLGHYEVREVVGRGGMGVVLKAFDQQLHRVVAIKVMAPQLATGATARKRFVREARAQAAVTHDHVVTIHAVKESGRLPYIVMQFVAGTSLQERLDRTEPLPLTETLRIGAQTAAGLAAAHARGLVHRDVKPANILLENGVERVRLTDFGLARAADDASLTQSGLVAGTPSFMSPEQAEGKAVDHRSDLFSLGSVLYAMCTGRPPFRAGTGMGVLKRVCEETPTPIRETNPEVPDWLAAVVERLHAKDPVARFQSAAEVAGVLGRQLAHLQNPSAAPLPAVAAGAESPARRVSRKRWAVAAAAVAALFAVLGTTEATGVTNVRATVTRVFAPEGALVVETDDPGVKVTVEGDGGLVVTGAGLEEIRLRPGSYRVLADRDGQRVPLDRELVAVSRGGREVVRVKLAAMPAANAEAGAFVLLAAGQERRFDTLAAAVRGAAGGDTVEIRGNGPFVTKPVAIPSQALTIRAGAGSLPVIRADPDEQAEALISSEGSLVLEGLDLQWVNAKPGAPRAGLMSRSMVISNGPAARLYAANCRFLMNRREGPHHMRCVGAFDSTVCHLRNCQLLVCGHGTGYPAFPVRGGPNSSLVVENCLVGFAPMIELTHVAPTKAVLNHNTFFGERFLTFRNSIDPAGTAVGSPALEVVASANLFEGPMQFVHLRKPGQGETELTGKDGARAVRQTVGWRDHGNLYSSADGSGLLTLWLEKKPNEQVGLTLPVPVTT